MQFFGEHEELRQLLNEGYKTLEEVLQTQVSHTKDKIESVATLGNDIVVEATAASAQQLHDMETYMKKRKVGFMLLDTASCNCSSNLFAFCLLLFA